MGMLNIDRSAEDRTRIDRISEMEQYLDDATTALRELDSALEGYEAALPELRALAAYYDSGDWRRDYEADEAGLLPQGLKRGVLSQDALYDLLTDHEALRRRLHELCKNDPTD